MMRWTIGLGLMAMLLAGAGAWAAEGESILADDRENADWKVDNTTATFAGRGDAVLVIDSASYRSAPLTLTIDANIESVQLKSGSRRIELPLDGDGPTHTITLIGGDEAQVLVDGQPSSAAGRTWQRIAGKSKIDLILPNAGKAKVSWQRGATPTTGEGDLPTVAGVATAGEPVAAGRIKRALVRLRMPTDVPGVAIAGQAIVIGPHGVMLARAHVLVGAESVEAVLPLGEPVALRILAVDPARDLVLLRMDPTNDRWQTVVEAMEIAPEAAAEKSEVWAAGVDTNGRYVLGRAQVEAVKLNEALSPALQQQLGGVAGMQWIETDLPASAAVSGGPLVDAYGRLVGINAWVWPDQVEGGLAMSTKDVAAWRDATDSFASLPMAEVQKMLSDAALARTTFPILQTKGRFDPQNLQRTVNRAEQAGICPQCKGEAKVQVRRQTGYRTSGNLRVPVYEMQDVDCRRCGGTGLTEPRVVFSVMADVAGALAFADRSDPDFGRISQWTQDMLTTIGKRQTVFLATTLNSEMAARLADDRIKPGKPLAAVGWIMPLKSKTDGAEQHTVAKITGGSGERTIILREMDLPTSGRRQTAMVGGLLAGYVVDAEGQRVPVVQKGYAIPVPSEGIEEPASERTERRSTSRYRSGF